MTVGSSATNFCTQLMERFNTFQKRGEVYVYGHGIPGANYSEPKKLTELKCKVETVSGHLRNSQPALIVNGKVDNKPFKQILFPEKSGDDEVNGIFQTSRDRFWIFSNDLNDLNMLGNPK